MTRFYLLFLVAMLYSVNSYSQEKVQEDIIKNQLATNIVYLAMGSVNISYERTINNNFTVGISGVAYSDYHNKLGISTIETNIAQYEIHLFGRWYFRNTQRSGFFLEAFGSYNTSQEEDNVIRINNAQDYGVYTYGVKEKRNFGVGVGFGYRLLLANKKLVFEAQFGLRTNFELEFIVLDAAIVRSGLRVGYRF